MAYEISSVTRNNEHESQSNKMYNIGSRRQRFQWQRTKGKLKVTEIAASIPSVTSALSTDMMNMHFCKEKEQMRKVSRNYFTSRFPVWNIKFENLSYTWELRTRI